MTTDIDPEGIVRYGGECVCGAVYTYNGIPEPGQFDRDCPVHGERIDPLTCDWTELPLWPRTGEGGACEFCGVPPEAMHLEDCEFTPIYAEMMWRYAEDGDSPWEVSADIRNAIAMREKHLYLCHICKAVGYAENMVVVYSQSPMFDPSTPAAFLRNAKRVLYVVCERHNRVSERPAYQPMQTHGY